MKGKKSLSANTRNARVGEGDRGEIKSVQNVHTFCTTLSDVVLLQQDKTNAMIEIIIRQLLGLIKQLLVIVCNCDAKHIVKVSVAPLIAEEGENGGNVNYKLTTTPSNNPILGRGGG